MFFEILLHSGVEVLSIDPDIEIFEIIVPYFKCTFNRRIINRLRMRIPPLNEVVRLFSNPLQEMSNLPNISFHDTPADYKSVQ